MSCFGFKESNVKIDMKYIDLTKHSMKVWEKDYMVWSRCMSVQLMGNQGLSHLLDIADCK
jgi:hypothetical protein